MNPLERLGLVDGSPTPKLNLNALKRQGPRAYLMRFAFGAVIAAVAAIAGLGVGDRMGGILLAFPAILPASLTLIERKEGRRIAAIDAMGAILGSVCRRAGVGGAGERPLRLDRVAAAAAKEPARQSKAHQQVAGRPLSDRRTGVLGLLNLEGLLLIALALVLLDDLDRTPDCP